MISMEKMEITPSEPKVNPDIPAKDKKAGIKVEKETEPEEEKKVSDLVEQLFAALKEEGIETVPVKSLSAEESMEIDDIPPAIVYRSFLTDQNAVAFALWGLPEKKRLNETVKLLEKNHADATFFVTESEALERSEEIVALEERGFSIGMRGKGLEQGKDGNQLYKEMISSSQKISRAIGRPIMLYLAAEGTAMKDIYLETELRQAVAMAGCILIAPEEPNPGEPNPGAIYCFDLSQADALKEMKLVLADVKGYKVWDTADMLSVHGTIGALPLQTIEALREKNGGNLAQPATYVYTTEPAMSFLFFGVRNKPVLHDIMNRLEKRESNGTFFATLAELQSCQEQIEELLRAGNELGVAYVENSQYPANFESVMRYVHSCQAYIAWRYGTKAETVFFPYGEPKDEALEAVSAMGCRLAGAGVSMVKSQHKTIAPEDIESVLDDDFGKIHLTRGAMVYFNGNYYEYDQNLGQDYQGTTVCGDMVEAVFERFVDPIAYRDMDTGEMAKDSQYSVKPCGELMTSSDCYTLAARMDQCGISLNNHILTAMANEEERMEYISSRYIGTPSADEASELPGFTKEEIEMLDKSGRFTDDKVLFLTFDDWGTDQALNHLLYVLKKHDVKATFFIRTNYIKDNINLLRAIAMDGHEIASHSHEHMPLANYVETRQSYISLTEEQTKTLREDLVRSYQELYKYIGEITIHGVPALSTCFRPPTLAVSKAGLSQVFDVGFSYSVSGSSSTHDYEAENVTQLLDQLQNGIKAWNGRMPIQNGSIVVMHMSDESRYTAHALDRMIPVWKEQGYDFARIDDYLTEKVNDIQRNFRYDEKEEH